MTRQLAPGFAAVGMNGVINRRKMHCNVLLPEESLRVSSEWMLFHPLLDNGNTVQLVRSGSRSHSLVTRNETPPGLDGEITIFNLPIQKFQSPAKHIEELAGPILGFAISLI